MTQTERIRPRFQVTDINHLDQIGESWGSSVASKFKILSLDEGDRMRIIILDIVFGSNCDLSGATHNQGFTCCVRQEANYSL
jgi:hypothetical protein